MKEKNTARNLILISILFLLSRVVFHQLGLQFSMIPLLDYWQYPDFRSLRDDVFRSLWYQAAQPPLFNLLLSLIIKLGGAYASTLFAGLFMFFSLANSWILCRIVNRITANSMLALIIALIYLLSPSTILLENELFYTGFVSLLLLFSVWQLIRLREQFSFGRAFLFFSLLAMLCLTRSFYHLGWMLLTVALLAIHHWPSPGARKLLLAALLPLMLVTGWYGKNFVLFGKFGAGSWSGMNLARVVFHETPPADSNSIARIPPFSRISAYNSFIEAPSLDLVPAGQERVLLAEFKNFRHLNLYHIGYLQVSEQYTLAAKKQIKEKPLGYLKNAGKAMIIFFTPASSYFKLADNEKRMRFYDAAFALNFSAFFEDEPSQKKTLAISGLIIFFTWLVVLNAFRKEARGEWQFPASNFFILLTIAYVFLVGSFFEYGENMRFRYEVQPLFLILLAQFLEWRRRKKVIPSFHI